MVSTKLLRYQVNTAKLISVGPHAVQVSVGFSPDLQAPAHQQLEWLENLARALDAAPDLQLSGLAIQLGLEGSGTDQQGSLWLQADAHPLQWTQ